MRTSLVICRAMTAVLVCGLFAPQHALHAQTKPKRTDLGQVPESVLWVGNSFFYYNNSMHGHLAPPGETGGPGARGPRAFLTDKGFGLGWHDMESLLRP